MSTFHTGGPGGFDGFIVEPVDLGRVDEEVFDTSIGLFKLSRVSNACVCACCSVGGVALACVRESIARIAAAKDVSPPV